MLIWRRYPIFGWLLYFSDIDDFSKEEDYFKPKSIHREQFVQTFYHMFLLKTFLAYLEQNWCKNRSSWWSKNTSLSIDWQIYQERRNFLEIDKKYLHIKTNLIWKVKA
ncbi:unnamed protein product [Blepharisma stoltei]|uniref:Uncharacterized protein n=1 Tax=Blepharisma stoltei TaxID=1481888 RepID=A0AAU9KB53_9CILI|nr:unnamed protein product [Blepharisma stoltei]